MNKGSSQCADSELGDSPIKYEELKDSAPQSHAKKTAPNGGESNELTELVPGAEGEKKSSRRSKLIFILLLVAYFGCGCGFSIPAPFYPREAASKNVSSTTFGLVFGCFQLVNFISSPLFGQFLPDIGPRTMCTTGILLAGGSSILFGFLYKMQSKPVFVAFSFIFRIFEALGVSAFTTSSFAIICTEFETQAASVFALLEGAVGIGLMVGPTLGGGLYQLGGFGLPFWVIGAVIVINGVVILTFLPPVTDDVCGKGRSNILKLLTSPLVWVTMLLQFISSLALVFLEPTLSIHLAQFNLSAFEISLFFVIIPLLHAALAPFYGYLSDKKNIQAPLMMVSCITCAVGFLLIGPTPVIPTLPNKVWLKVLALVVFGSFFSCTIIQTMKCMIIGAIEIGLPNSMNTFGLVAGLFNSVFYLGAFVGPTVGGVMMDTIGFDVGTTVIAALFLATFVVYALFFGYRRLLRNKKKSVWK
ncbi:hypothetical protein RRG08_008703 [Elysia crispata]|uniref:Major facilitator superfamily (MFS) profile domain-containing protein n=1 Tax=Elysia crispata TaxID=231223 RepID=A0AAE0XPN4_9GAST|nr:hypothetical protein RRG08_008703 [Elysia crispata]